MTRTKFIILIVAIAIILIGALLALLYHSKPQPAGPGAVGFPSASSTGTTGGGTAGGSTGGSGGGSTGSTSSGVVIAGLGTSTVGVSNFIDNGVTVADPANPTRYLLAGSLGYCTPAGVCGAASTTNFTVFFDTEAQSFAISLTAEPIGEARRAAEAFLEQTLGIGPTQMCQLRAYVGTTYWVNELYDDKNLGFSFCPGATALPQ